ncbi:MAG TPA: peptidylprolyl isomerase [Acidobacteriaceae bacterium]|nr:peptidylprolyl isomerase [Acidobacteriaceae bacterium]
MTRKVTINGILWLLLATAGAQVASHAPSLPASPASGGQAVARVNGVVLTADDLLREEYTIFPYARQHNGIPKEFEAQIRDGALKMIVFEELVYQEALREKLTVPPARLQRAEAEFRRQFPTPEEFTAFLNSQFQGSEQLLREKIRRSLLIDAFLKARIDDRSTVSPAEARAFYDRNPARFRHPETYTFQTISVLPPANATPEQLKEGRARAQQALVQARATKTAEQFGLLAEKISDDDYRVVMGQHRPVPVDQLAPQVVRALRAMKVGEISGVIQIDDACTIVRLGRHTPAGIAKFEEVKAPLEQQLHEQKRNQMRAALDRELRQNARVEEF